MKEVHGNLWDAKADYTVITTNGVVREDGAAVMGRGVAFQAKDRYPGLEYTLGRRIKLRGNHVSLMSKLISFPVKHHWQDPADLELIKQSTEELVILIDHQALTGYPTSHIAMPRPGCGNGRLDWKDVQAVIEPLLDDRFTVYNND
ncbi:hypothetical protein LCGC14_1076920 [marine sediment metagenome]|uniref:Macro domain-containing protein n=1 Tax=marine sediment metagenome TaxID=412755 RepID=A0A0F9MGH8_9ZZZZ